MAEVLKHQCIIGNLLLGDIPFPYPNPGTFDRKVQLFLALLKLQLSLFTLIDINKKAGLVFFAFQDIKFSTGEDPIIGTLFCP